MAEDGSEGCLIASDKDNTKNGVLTVYIGELISWEPTFATEMQRDVSVRIFIKATWPGAAM